jgi:hypothetical protein
LTFAQFSIAVSALNFADASSGVNLSAGVTTTTVDFMLTRTGGWSFLGTWVGAMLENRGSVRVFIRDVDVFGTFYRTLTFSFTPGPGSPCFQRTAGFNAEFQPYTGAGGGSFNVSVGITGGGTIVMTGRTTSPNTAEGTYRADAQYCGALENTTWTATKQ